MLLATSRAASLATSTFASVNCSTFADSCADKVATLQINAPRARMTGMMPTTASTVASVEFTFSSYPKSQIRRRPDVVRVMVSAVMPATGTGDASTMKPPADSSMGVALALKLKASGAALAPGS